MLVLKQYILLSLFRKLDFLYYQLILFWFLDTEVLIAWKGNLTYDVCFYFVHWQLIEVTGKTQDECMVALHDCNEDVNRAINFLLESTSDTVCIHIYIQKPQSYICSVLLNTSNWVPSKTKILQTMQKIIQYIIVFCSQPFSFDLCLSELLGDSGEEAEPWKRRRTLWDKGDQGEERSRERGQSWAGRIHQEGERHQPRAWRWERNNRGLLHLKDKKYGLCMYVFSLCHLS